MPYIASEDILRAKQMDILTYLQNYEPHELVHVSGNTYCTREHDSLKISNGKWCWFSRRIGERSALDYLIKVKGYPFLDAVEAINGQSAVRAAVPYARKSETRQEPKKLLLPEISPSTWHVERYLKSRGISPEIIRYCIDHRLLFETEQYHNCLFIGYDKAGKARYGALCGTIGYYKGDLTGSDKRYSFSLNMQQAPKEIHVFEAAIDALSYAMLEQLAGRDWRSESYLSLTGVYQSKRTGAVPEGLPGYKKCPASSG